MKISISASSKIVASEEFPLTKVPDEYAKWYRVQPFSEVEEEMGPEEAREYVDEQREMLKAYGYDSEILGFVTAKDEYYDALSNNGLENAVVIKESGGPVYVGFFVHDRFYPIDKREIEMCGIDVDDYDDDDEDIEGATQFPGAMSERRKAQCFENFCGYIFEVDSEDLTKTVMNQLGLTEDQMEGQEPMSVTEEAQCFDEVCDWLGNYANTTLPSDVLRWLRLSKDEAIGLGFDESIAAACAIEAGGPPKGMSFNEWLDWTRYEGFSEAISELSDEEYYELEDEYQDYLKSCSSIGCSTAITADVWDEIAQVDQEFTSENTSINKNKLPALFNMVKFPSGSINVDVGGGKYDNVAEYLEPLGVINLVYDPYNRSAEHNQEVIKTLKEAGGADSGTCSNVLNVIKEPEARLNVLKNMSKMVKPGGDIYITVYEGSGKGDEGQTSSGYQLNRKTKDYLEEIQQVFPNAERKGKLIVATN